MTDRNAAFAGSIPAVYDRCLGPLLFEPYAEALLAAVDWSRSQAVLEVAAGTGIVTERLRRVLPASARLVATDLNPDMLAIAGERVRATGIEWRPADAMSLPFDDATFDDVVCQFGVMFFPDKLAAMRETRRVLRPGGRFVFNVWGSLDSNPMFRLASEIVPRYFTSDPPDFYQVPFSCHDEPMLRRTLSDAGFEVSALEAVDRVGHCPTAREAATGVVTGNPTVVAIRERATAPEETVIDAVAAAFADAGGVAPFKMPLRAIQVVARAR